MKIWMIVAAIGLLAIAGFVVADAVADAETVELDTSPSVSTCNGGCSAGNVCSNSACGVRTGKGCGCQG